VRWSHVVPSSDIQTTPDVVGLIEVRPYPSVRTRPLYGPAGTVDRLHTMLSGALPLDGGIGVSGVNVADADVDTDCGVEAAVAGWVSALPAVVDEDDVDDGDGEGDVGEALVGAVTEVERTVLPEPHAASNSTAAIADSEARPCIPLSSNAWTPLTLTLHRQSRAARQGTLTRQIGFALEPLVCNPQVERPRVYLPRRQDR
jgi:hypothetical protein